MEHCRGRRVLYFGVSDCAGGVSRAALRTKDVGLSWRGFDPDRGLAARFPQIDVRFADLNEDFGDREKAGLDGDYVVVTEVLEHILWPVLTLRRLSAALPGVEFLMSVPNCLSAGRVVMAMTCVGKYLSQDVSHVQLYNRTTLEATFRAGGIADFSITPYMQRYMIVAACFPELAQGFVIEGRFPSNRNGER